MMKTKSGFTSLRLRRNLLIIIICIPALMPVASAFAQVKTPYVRIAKIVVDSTQIKSYKAALKEHAQAAVKKEAGVLTLYAVYDKVRPTHVTVFEIYAGIDAYKSHIQTSHFLKYKTTVKDMVKSLELTDVIPIALEAKTKLSN